jgi:RNA polymerase sigma-54 factor
MPDFFVEADGHGGSEVRLANEHTPHLSVSRLYRSMLKSKQVDPGARVFIRERIQAAHRLIDAIKQRNCTLLRIARATLEYQKDFLEKGAEGIRPLTMAGLADDLGIDDSVVNRAVNGKWVQGPRGVFPLRQLFASGPKKVGSTAITWDAVKRLIQEIVSREERCAPLSDKAIADELAKQGVKVERRTVTKYRNELGIKSGRLRRQRQ